MSNVKSGVGDACQYIAVVDGVSSTVCDLPFGLITITHYCKGVSIINNFYTHTCTVCILKTITGTGHHEQ